MIEYINGYALFDGLKFKKDSKTGYYLNSSIRKRLHRYVWSYYKGEIKKGHQVHHIDNNKDNNDISNLIVMTGKEHLTMHGKERMKDKDLFNRFHSQGIIEAKKWHKSKEGIQWHKEHYEKMKGSFYQEDEYICTNCGNKFIAVKSKENKYCTNKCKSANRRKIGVDNETRKCRHCNAEYQTNKYSKVKNCSRSCANKSRNNNI